MNAEMYSGGLHKLIIAGVDVTTSNVVIIEKGRFGQYAERNSLSSL